MEAASSSTKKAKVKKFPVVEIFGPTIQGEGPEQGLSVYFVRFGGCDYKCDWCDSPFAVLPELVRNAGKVTVAHIVSKIQYLAPGPNTVVFSGGNPLLHELANLVTDLHTLGYRVTVETQGTVFKPWLNNVDTIVVSPKPPSSGMNQRFDSIARFLNKTIAWSNTYLKIVIFDRTDLEWTKEVHARFPAYKMYLSAGNDAGATVGNPGRVDHRLQLTVATDLINKGRWLANQVMIDPELNDVQVQMQQHVLFWGNERGR